VTSVPPPQPPPGSPLARPELPVGVVRGDGAAPPPAPAPQAERGWPLWAPFAAMAVTAVLAVVGVSIIAFAASIGGVDVTADDTPPGVTLGGLLVQDLALVFSALLLARLTGGPPAAWQFGLLRTRLGPAIGWVILAWLMFVSFSALWAAIANVTENDDLPQELGADESTAALIAVAVLVCVLAPVAEEFFFRGFLFTALRRRLHLIGGAIVTGIVFGAVHAGSADPEFLPPLAFFGFVLCLLYHWTGSLLPCIVLHALNNALALGVSQDFSAGGTVAVMIAAAAGALALSLPFTTSPRFNPGRPAPQT
jgi:membrane protease YdiL (CAAX protease family)